MTRAEFMEALSRALRGLPRSEIKKALGFYGEMLDDRIEEGADETAAVLSMEAPELIAERLKRAASEREGSKKGETSWVRVLLLALGSPVWLSLLIAAVAVAAALYVSLWAILISLYAALLALALGVPGFMIGGIVALGLPNFFLGMGGSLLSLGFGLLLYQVVGPCTKGLLCISNFLFRKIAHRRRES